MKRLFCILLLVTIGAFNTTTAQAQDGVAGSVWDAGGILGITSDGDSLYFTLPESHASTALFKAAVTFSVGITVGTSLALNDSDTDSLIFNPAGMDSANSTTAGKFWMVMKDDAAGGGGRHFLADTSGHVYVSGTLLMGKNNDGATWTNVMNVNAGNGLQVGSDGVLSYLHIRPNNVRIGHAGYSSATIYSLGGVETQSSGTTDYLLDPNNAGAGVLNLGVSGDADTTEVHGFLKVTHSDGEAVGYPDISGANDVAVFGHVSGSGDNSNVYIVSGNAGNGGLYFGDTDAELAGGFDYDNADNSMDIYIGATIKWHLNSSGSLFSNSGDGPMMVNENSSSTNPVFIPDQDDPGTGVGGVQGEVSLISNSIELLTAVEGAIDIIHMPTGTALSFNEVGGASGNGYIQHNSSQMDYSSFSGHDFINWDGAAYSRAMLIGGSSSLNVTVGTASSAIFSSSRFSVNGNAGSDSIAVFSNDANATLDSTVTITERGHMHFGNKSGDNHIGIKARGSGWGISIEEELTTFDAVQLTSTSNAGQLLLKDAGGNTLIKLNAEEAGGGVDNYINIPANFGIGTASPANLVHVSATTGATIQVTDSDQGVTSGDGLLMRMDGTEAYYTNQENGPLYIATNATTRMTILAGGNVGIGTTSPGGLLNIESINVANAPNILADDLIIEGDNTGISIMSTTTGNIYFGDASADTQGGIEYTHSSDQIQIRAGNVAVQRMTTALVTFNKDSADQDYEIFGDTGKAGRVFFEGSSSKFGLTGELGTPTFADSSVYLSLSSGHGAIFFVSANGAGGNYIFADNSDQMRFDGSSTYDFNGQVKSNTMQVDGATGYVSFTGATAAQFLYDANLTFNSDNTAFDVIIEPDVITSGSNTGAFVYDAGNGRMGISAERSNGSPTGAWADSSAWLGIVNGDGQLQLMAGDGDVFQIYGDGSLYYIENDNGGLQVEGGWIFSAGTFYQSSDNSASMGLTNKTFTGMFYENQASKAGTDNEFFMAAGDTIVYDDGASQFQFVGAARSERRFKDHVATIPNALAKVSAMRGVNFQYTDESGLDTRPQIGFIADEVAEVVPELTFQGRGYKTVDYEKATALLVEAIKELQARIEQLEARN